MRRAFVCAPYAKDEACEMKPEGEISRCPSARCDESCEIKRNGFRSRKTGPGYPLQIMKCKSHGSFFTVYPPGFVPYGRQRIAPVAAGGCELEASGLESGLDERWQGTIFRCGRICGGP